MKTISKFKVLHPAVRASLVTIAAASVVTTMTLAALQSSASLTGNTISSPGSALKISKDDVTYSNIQPGFVFDDVIPPQATPAAGHQVWLRNDSNENLAISVSLESAPTSSVVPSGTVDLTQVSLIFERPGSQPASEYTLQALVDAHATGGLSLNEVLIPNDDNELFTIKARIQAAAFDGSEATINDLHIVFDAIAVPI